MIAIKSAATFPLACALAFILTLAMTALPPQFAAAQTIRDHRTPPIVRDHRAKQCRVVYSEHPGTSGFPAVTHFCALPANSTALTGSYCSCSVLIEGHYQTVPGSVVLVNP
jgi:hypothetical protein